MAVSITVITVALKQADVHRTLRPFTLHAQQVMAEARAGLERLPETLTLVQRALDHAGLKETVGLALRHRAAPCSFSQRWSPSSTNIKTCA
jgi:hypothetical protein